MWRGDARGDDTDGLSGDGQVAAVMVEVLDFFRALYLSFVFLVLLLLRTNFFCVDLGTGDFLPLTSASNKRSFSSSAADLLGLIDTLDWFVLLDLF